METIILQGFLAGVIISLPKGPAGFFIIQQTIAYGSKRGLALSLGLIATTLISSFIILFFIWKYYWLYYRT